MVIKTEGYCGGYEMKYRMLKKGEVIKQGDVFGLFAGSSIGQKFRGTGDQASQYYRPIKSQYPKRIDLDKIYDDIFFAEEVSAGKAMFKAFIGNNYRRRKKSA